MFGDQWVTLRITARDFLKEFDICEIDRLKVVNLSGKQLNPLGIDANIFASLAYEVTQQWASFFMDHPDASHDIRYPLLGDIASSRPAMAEAISLAKELNDTYGLAVALHLAAALAHMEHNIADVERYSSDLIELSTRHHFALWIATGAAYRGWARCASGQTSDGISCIKDGIRNYRETGADVNSFLWVFNLDWYNGAGSNKFSPYRSLALTGA